MDKELEQKLQSRKENQSYRELRDYSHLVDFSSNDYLGLASNLETEASGTGSTGSRLISGNFKAVEELEKELANFHGMPAGLIFNSGYTANLGLFSTLPQRGDTVLYDSLIHASIRDGLKLSNAKSYSFKHNDLNHLEERLKTAEGNVFVAVESIYSMDGDSPNLIALLNLCESYNAHLIVDEAHAVGVVGKMGEGLVAQLGLQDKVYCTVVTFGKAMGCHGAIVLGSATLRNFLINYCRSFIYTTGPSPQTIATIQQQYNRMKNLLQSGEGRKSQELKNELIKGLKGAYDLVYGEYGNIVSVVIPGVESCKAMAASLEEKGYFVKAILSPTVEKGKERLRICLHEFNTKAQIEELQRELLPVVTN